MLPSVIKPCDRAAGTGKLPIAHSTRPSLLQVANSPDRSDRRVNSSLTKRIRRQRRPIGKMISDDDLYRLAIFLGSAAMILIVIYHFLEVNAADDDAVKAKVAAKAGGAQSTQAGKQGAAIR